MGAKTAADALVKFDTELRDRIEALESRGGYWWIQEGASAETDAILRDCAGTWTLSLAAESAGVTERQVLVALARFHLHRGTQICAEGAVTQALA